MGVFVNSVIVIFVSAKQWPLNSIEVIFMSMKQKDLMNALMAILSLSGIYLFKYRKIILH